MPKIDNFLLISPHFLVVRKLPLAMVAMGSFWPGIYISDVMLVNCITLYQTDQCFLVTRLGAGGQNSI